MSSAYATAPSPAAPVPAPTSGDCDRISAVLAELAPIRALFTDGGGFRIVPTAVLDPCGTCPEVGFVADGDAVLVVELPDGRVYRQLVCVPHLADDVADELRAARGRVSVEIPVAFTAPVARWRGCFCNPAYSQSCQVCDGTLAELAGRI